MFTCFGELTIAVQQQKADNLVRRRPGREASSGLGARVFRVLVLGFTYLI